MKANELMIGDWVMFNPNQFNDDEYDFTKDSYPKQIQSGEEIDIAIEDCYTPIPITEEILKANGFPCENDCYIIKCERRINKIVSWKCSIIFSDYDCRIRYVHELQHALRLCGLYELADDFEIK